MANVLRVQDVEVDTSDPAAGLRKYIELSFEMLNRDAPPEGFFYKNSYDFLLRHGKAFEPRELPAKMWQGPPRACYGNSIVLGVVAGLRYVEGIAVPQITSGAFFPCEHAWNTDAEGRFAFDATWHEPGVAYFGVEFSVERADDATWNGDSCVLNDYQRRHPLMRQEWKGEDWAKRWPKSRRLDLIRRNYKAGNWRRHPSPEPNLTAREMAAKIREMFEAFEDDDGETRIELEVSKATESDLDDIRAHLTPEENAKLKLRREKTEWTSKRS
jgi:hypothetical protein